MQDPELGYLENRSRFFTGPSDIHASYGNLQDFPRAQHITDEDLFLLDKLPHVKNAGYRSANNDICLTGTRTRDLQRIDEWEADYSDKRIYWFNGGMGVGKSTIAKTFAERSSAKGRLGASFFCSRDFPDRRGINLIFPTLAYNLAVEDYSFKAALLPIINSVSDEKIMSPAFQLENFLVRPLKSTGLSTTIVIDALDECMESNPASEILSLLAQHIDSIPFVKFFLTSRPEPPIRVGFRTPLSRRDYDVILLHQVDRASLNHDIVVFLQTRLGEIVARRSRAGVTVAWPTDQEIVAAANKCSGLFIVASIIVRIVADHHHEPQEQLNSILGMPDNTVHDGRSGLDQMYRYILHRKLEDIDILDNDFLDMFRVVVGSIALAFNPLSRVGLARILDISRESVQSVIRSFHSILVVPHSDSQPMQIFHNSLAHFLTNHSRCTDRRFFIEPSTQHSRLGTCCLSYMNKTLKNNLCDLPLNIMNKDIKNLAERRQKYIGDGLEYACRWWAKHLRFAFKGGASIGQIIDLLEYFFEHHLSPWIETLSIMGSMSYGISSLRDIRDWLVKIDFGDASLLAVIEDAESFVRKFSDSIEASASHVYQCESSWYPKSPLVRALGKRSLHSDRGRPYPPPTVGNDVILTGAGGIPMLPKSKPVRKDITDPQTSSQSDFVSGAKDKTAVVSSNPNEFKGGSGSHSCQCVLQ